jgi:hypothetical protein
MSARLSGQLFAVLLILVAVQLSFKSWRERAAR